MRAFALYIASGFVFTFLLAGCSITVEQIPKQTVPADVEPVVATPAVPPPETPPAPITLNVMAVGDIMLGTDYPDNRLPDNDGADLMRDIKPVFLQADIVFGNFEG